AHRQLREPLLRPGDLRPRAGAAPSRDRGDRLALGAALRTSREEGARSGSTAWREARAGPARSEERPAGLQRSSTLQGGAAAHPRTVAEETESLEAPPDDGVLRHFALPGQRDRREPGGLGGRGSRQVPLSPLPPQGRDLERRLREHV